MKRHYRLIVWLTALILALATYLQPGTHLWPGMDQAWAYAINYGFFKGLVMGRDMYFTFGPLGFLEHTRLLSNDMLYFSSLFSLVIAVGMNAALLHLAWISAEHRPGKVTNIILAVILVIFSFPEMQRLLILGYILLLLHWLTNRSAYLVLQALVITCCLFIKFSYGAAALSLWGAYLFLHYRRDRNVLPGAIALAALIIGYSTIWFLMYGSLSGTLGYLEGEFYISRGNTSAMAINPDNNWLAIIIFYGACVLSAAIVHHDATHRYRWLPATFALPLFVWTKYTFAQEQALHFIPLLDFAVFIMLLFAIVVTGFMRKLVIALLLVVACLSWKAMHTPAIGTPDYPNVPHSTINQPEVVQYRFHYRKLFNIWRAAETERLEPLRLPKDMREIVGDASVDVYPWELTIVAANNLNWQPRPAFQTYIAYLPFLDRKNAEFFNSAAAPEYIVWHHHEAQDIMNRYAPSSEPLTFESLLRHYQRVQCEGIFCLWKRASTDQLLPPRNIRQQTATWDAWIDLPLQPDGILRVQVDFQRSLAGVANLLLWKEGGVEIDYRLRSGDVRTHDLLIDNAVSGVWVSPYIENYLGDTRSDFREISAQRVHDILAHTPAEGYMEKIESTGSGYRFIGWATQADSDTREQQQYILLYNAARAFLVRADKFNRSDVIDAYKSQGKSMSGQCGYYQEVRADVVPAGDYRIRFVVEHQGTLSAVPDQNLSVHMDPALNRNQVIAIRFHTIRPWAFSGELQLQWQELDFIGVPPWK